MADVDITTTGLRELQVDLERAVAKAPAEVAKVVAKGALNIKQDWARRWAGLGHAPAVSRAVSYDPKFALAGAAAEIGPDKERKQGALANLFEFGSVNNPPIPGGMPALAAEEPRFVQALEDLAERLIT